MDPFGEQWFSEDSQKALVDLYERTAGIDGRIIEVGCWTGRSTVALANACKPNVVHAVDTWQGSHGEISASLAAERDVYAQFHRNIFTMTAGNVVPWRMDWRLYFTRHRTPIRFLHIDACHSYREVFDNIEAAKPFMASGSIMCGDDVHHPPVQQAVMDSFPAAAFVLASLWWVQL